MKRFVLQFKDVGEKRFNLLENSCSELRIIDNGRFYFNDMATGARILSSMDELAFCVDPEQETILKLAFGDKMIELT